MDADRYEPRVPRMNRYAVQPGPGEARCPHCSKTVKIAGVADHVRDMHPEKA